jgi:transcriptional/translational regulatory protein YebC/TACO1
VIIDVNTDNRNRAIASIKTILNRHNTKLAETGSVSYLFETTGVMTVKGKTNEETEMAIIESGADDYDAGEYDSFTVYTEPKETSLVAQKLQAAGLQVRDIELAQEPKATLQIDDPKIGETIVKMLAELEELDDVSAVYTNFDARV